MTLSHPLSPLTLLPPLNGALSARKADGGTPPPPFDMLTDATFFSIAADHDTWTLGGTDGLYVQGWIDQSPNGNDLLPASADAGPEISIYNTAGAATLNFSSSQQLAFTDPLITGNDVVIVFCSGSAISPNNESIFQQDDGATAGRVSFTNFFNGTIWTQRMAVYYHDGTTNHNGATTTTIFDGSAVCAIRFTAAGECKVKDGIAGSWETIFDTGAGFTWGDIPFELLGSITASGFEFAALAIYNRVEPLTDANVNQVMQYFYDNIVAPDEAVPQNIYPPEITGTMEVGQTLTVSTGLWSGGGITYTYQWKRDGVDISGATSSTYELVSADEATIPSCVVTATNTAGADSDTATGSSVAPEPSVDERYWDPGSNDTWNATAGTKWAATSGGATGAALPTTADAVFFDANSTGNCAITASSVWKDLDMTGYTATMTLASSTTVSARGNVILEGAATYTAGSQTSSIFDYSQAGTHYLDGDGASWLCRLQINGASTTLRLAGNASFGTTLLGAGNFYTDGYDLTCAGAFSATGSSTRTLDITNSTVTTSAWTVSGTNITLTSTGSHIINTATGNTTVTPGGYSYNIMTLATNSSFTITTTLGAGSFAELRVPNDTTELSGNITATTLTTLGGNLTRANLITTSVADTQRTITASNVSVTGRVIFEGIAGAGAFGWDLSGVESGDGGRNTGITFAAPVTGYWRSAGGTQSAYVLGNWANVSGGTGGTAARIPTLPQDTAVFDANSPSGTVVFNTADNRLGGFNFTGWDGSACTLPNCTIYGSFVAPSGTVTFSGNSDIVFNGRDAGNSFSCVPTLGGTGTKTFMGYWTFGANYTGTGDFTVSAPCDIDCDSVSLLIGGNFLINNSANINIDLSGVTISPVGTPTGSTSGGIVIGASANVTEDSSTTYQWNQPATNRVINLNGRTTPANYQITLGSGTLTINSSNTWNGDFTVASTGNNNIRFQNNSTQTFGGALTSFTGTSGNVIDINRVSSGVVNMVKTSGTVTFDYCTITNVAASGGATFTATNCTDGGGNSGITFI